MAPGLGLYLDELFFTGYNQKQVRDKERRVIDSARAREKEKKKVKYATQEQVKASALLAVQKALEQQQDQQSLPPTETHRDQHEISEEKMTETETEGQDHLSTAAIETKEENEPSISHHHNSSSSSSGNNNSATGSIAEAEVGGEPILWWSDPSIRSDIDRFKTEQLYPHIFEQERSTLAFLYFLDYSRVKTFHNKIKN